ncbi:MAG: cation:proton antiporter [Planctomycetaceae bacterium]|nr:cation:proton antiporter [Planctomycetaceae bacterium]
MSPEENAGLVLILLGMLLLAGYAAHVLGAKIHVPRVTLLMLIGVASGPYVFNLVPTTVEKFFPYVAHLSLAMVGFLLGEGFIGRDLRRLGPTILWVPITKTILAALFVFATTFAVEQSLTLALLLAGIAPSSAPAATLDVIRQNHANGVFAKTVLKVVAIDDAYGIILFTVLLAISEAIQGGRGATTELLFGLWDIFGAILLGILLGLPMAWLTGRLRQGEPALLEATGFVFLCGGLATLFDVSYLLACMVLGIVVANRARHYTRPFHAIEGASEPFLAIFFILAGFRLELDALMAIGILGLSYVLARSAGLILGGRIGATLAKAPPLIRRHIGWCLLPQAGVALGLALLAAERVPEYHDRILSLVIATTVVFELIGPLFTQRHLRLAEVEHKDRTDTVDVENPLNLST